MSVSKRMRFEILRRDGFRCYYCGTRGNETTNGLTVDHVTPSALGGTDLPENLVAACGDCNGGKSATLLDSATVREASTSIAEAAEKVQLSAQAAAVIAVRLEAYSEQVSEAWRRVAPSYAPMPHDADGDINRWFTAQVPVSIVERGFSIAWSRQRMAKTVRFRYAAGVIRRLLDEAGDA
jgi:hypothetical protein